MERIATALFFCATLAAAAEPEVLKLSGDVEGVHDPVIIKQKDTYYVFCTGGGRGGAGGIIPVRTSLRISSIGPTPAPRCPCSGVPPRLEVEKALFR